MQADRLGDMTRVRFSLPHVGDEQWFLLRSDAHHDSPYARNAIEKRHLDEAAERGAGVLDFGDLFDAMQSPHDPRRSMRGRRADHMTDAYFNVLLDDAEAFYAPYADRILLLGEGNHEGAVTRNCGFDLTRELVRRLNGRGGTVQRGGYCGWVRFSCTYKDTRMISWDMFYTHGSGGNAPVTEGLIQQNRRKVMAADADIIVAGHIHRSHAVPDTTWRCNAKGIVEARPRLAIQVPGYKALDDWAMSRGFAPPPAHGAYWLRFSMEKGGAISVVAIPASDEPMRWAG